MLVNPWTMMAVGAGLGLLKNQLIEKPQYKRDLKLAAETQRYSPWTHMNAQVPQAPNALGDALSWGVTGGMMGQNMESAEAQKRLYDAYANNFGGGGVDPLLLRPKTKLTMPNMYWS